MAAVSLVLNNKGKGQISSVNQSKILEAAKRLNYRPSEIARSLLRKKSKILDLIIPAADSIFSTFFFLQVVGGIWKVVQQKGYKLILSFTESGQIGKKRKAQSAEGSYTDGSLILVDEKNPSLITRLKERGNPFVLINELDKDVDCVNVDYQEGAKIAAEHLINLGHKKICCVRGDLVIDSDCQRLAGYKEALQKYNLKVEDELIINGGFSEEKSFKAVRQLLEKKGKFTAIFAISDIMGIGAMEAVQQANLRVPQDIAVVGFDDIPLSSYVKPSLTTVKLPMTEMGEKAAQILIDRVVDEKKEKAQPVREVLKTKLVIRDSCGYYLERREL